VPAAKHRLHRSSREPVAQRIDKAVYNNGAMRSIHLSANRIIETREMKRKQRLGLNNPNQRRFLDIIC